jgi:hypothetical protein
MVSSSVIEWIRFDWEQGGDGLMSISEDVKRFYAANGISALGFRCRHFADCKGDCASFTTAREPFIGRKYELGGSAPRLLFISLDSGSGDPEPQDRTLESMRRWVEGCDIESFPKNRHWYLTHKMAFELLKQFEPAMRMESVCNYFAHTNSAKCSMNRDGRRIAHKRLFFNCREYMHGEIVALRPDAIITQGNYAKEAIERAFGTTQPESLDGCPYTTFDLKGRQALWIHTYHPRYFGGYYKQWKNCSPRWIDVLEKFWSTNRLTG